MLVNQYNIEIVFSQFGNEEDTSLVTVEIRPCSVSPVRELVLSRPVRMNSVSSNGRHYTSVTL